MTGRELISSVRSMNKLVSGDTTLTDRAIFSELKNTASLLIKRETNLRKLWNSPVLFTPIKCLKLKPIPLTECCGYSSDKIISRSEKKIPKIMEGVFGLIIQPVYSLGGKKYDYAGIDRYLNILRIGLRDTSKYFWLDEYLYVTDENLEFVNLYACFDGDINAEELSCCFDGVSDTCINPLDREFRIPSYLQNQLLSLVNDSLNKTYFRITTDRSTNNRDEQTPNWG